MPIVILQLWLQQARVPGGGINCSHECALHLTLSLPDGLLKEAVINYVEDILQERALVKDVILPCYLSG